MARLNKGVRFKIATKLRQTLPKHWRVTVGEKGQAFIEIDQDGKRPEDQVPEVGSTVILLENSPDGEIAVFPFIRIPCPQGYMETRQPYEEAPIMVGKGFGWPEQAAEVALSYALLADTTLLGANIVPGEA